MCAWRNSKHAELLGAFTLQILCPVYLEISERDVPVSGCVSVGAGHEQGVIFVQAADVLAMVG